MNQTERYDEIYRRGKVIMDVLDEVVKESEHEKLRDAVVEAALTFRVDGRWSSTSNWDAMRKSIDALIDFERGMKEKS
jgi:hypothetical protein